MVTTTVAAALEAATDAVAWQSPYVPGGLVVTVSVALDDAAAGSQHVVSHHDAVAHAGWWIDLDAGDVVLGWGDGTTDHTLRSDGTLPLTDGQPVTLRVEFDPEPVSGPAVVVFSYDNGGAWTVFDTVAHTATTAIVEPAGPGYVGKATSPNLEADVFTVTVADDIAMVWDAGFTACDPGSPTTCSVGGHTWVMNAAAQIRNPGLGGLVTGYTHEGHAVVSRTGPDETVTTYSYDLVGSMVGSSDGVTLGWDARNRMVTWTDGTVSWSYDYDSGGERRVASDGVTTRRYLDGLEVEVGGDSHITYTHAGQTVAVRDTTTGEVEVVVSDHLGSPQVAWNPTTAAVTGTRSHTPYGGLRTTSGTIPGTVGYTGQHADPTGLAYYGARYYSADLMVFISADTIIPDPGSAGGLNRYGYVAGNPVTFTDPSGHCGLVAGPDGEPIEDNTNCVHREQTNNPHLSYYYMYGNREAPDFFDTLAGLFRFLVFDNRQCSGDGSAVGCSIEVASALPWGKLGKLLKFLRHGDEAADALHLVDDAADTLRATNAIDDFAAGLARPTVSDPKLNQLMDELYRPGSTIGSGSTADALRYEIQTGLRVGGRSHVQKASDMARALEKWLRTSPDALPTDRAAAQSVIDDLWNALNGN